MAFDTKYRPQTYGDVLGQDASVAVLRQFIREGRGFHQSYVFCGQHGSGKTTMGRILARALLCDNPQDGNPCDECPSCRTLLTGGNHERFEELDAASKSGKADLARIVEDVSYSTFSGKRRIYLFDESHRLSKAALDVLLKPMEDAIDGTEDKQLVCIFCTTDPGKMSTTVFSRCAPAFVIRAVSPEGVAERLAHVASQEGISYEPDALVTLAEISECHIRDALKLLEGVSMLGPVTREAVSSYLRLQANDLVLTLLECLGSDLSRCIEVCASLSIDISPSAAYERVAEASLAAYRLHLEVGKAPSQWNAERLAALATRGSVLLEVSRRFAAPPHRPTKDTLALDTASLHYALIGEDPLPKVVQRKVEVFEAPQEPKSAPAEQKTEDPPATPQGTHVEDVAAKTTAGVWIDPRAVGRGPGARERKGVEPERPSIIDHDTFRNLVRHHLRELTRGGRTRPENVGRL